MRDQKRVGSETGQATIHLGLVAVGTGHRWTLILLAEALRRRDDGETEERDEGSRGPEDPLMDEQLQLKWESVFL